MFSFLCWHINLEHSEEIVWDMHQSGACPSWDRTNSPASDWRHLCICDLIIRVHLIFTYSIILVCPPPPPPAPASPAPHQHTSTSIISIIIIIIIIIDVKVPFASNSSKPKTWSTNIHQEASAPSGRSSQLCTCFGRCGGARKKQVPNLNKR